MLAIIPSADPPWQSSLHALAWRMQPGAKGDAVKDERGEKPDVDMSACLAAVGRSKDRAAFELLFRHFAPRVKGYLRRLGADAAAAEELMQEAMVTVWRRADRFDPAKASASTWIFTVARNLRIDAWRRDRRPEFDPSDPAFVPDDEPAPDASLDRWQDAERVNTAMQALSESEQAVLRLSFFEELSHSAIATQLAIPLGTVKSRLRLAFAKLRVTLGDKETGS